MSSEWGTQKLGDLFELVNGHAFRGSEFQLSGVPVLKIKNVKPNKILLDDLAYVDEKVAEKRPDKQVLRGDILITMSGNRMDGSKDTWVGKVAYFDLPGRYLLNQRVGILRPRPGVQVDRKCCSYFLSSEDYQQFFISVATSSGGQANLSPGQILKENFRLPPLNEQERISALLGALDDRITLLRETNATLEAIAQALFKSWFVDFDPVRAKLEGRTPVGTDEATAALFPDGFEESELGLVPRGWRVGTLADLSHLNPESWTAKNHPEFVAYLDLANAKGNEIASVTDFEFDEAPSRARRVLRDGDTIVGTVRPGNRSFAFINEPASNLTASTGFAVLRPSAIENTEFVYLAATQDSSIEHLAHVADGGAYPAVRPDVVSGLQIVVPDAQVLKAFHAVAVSLLAKVSENQKQAQTLATLRDTLLPRLISGQLRLPEVS